MNEKIEEFEIVQALKNLNRSGVLADVANEMKCEDHECVRQSLHQLIFREVVLITAKNCTLYYSLA